jgi:hypothetical protein
MSGLATEQHRVLQKIKVSCKTCGVSESYYSNLSVEKFKAKHSGHEVTDGSERAAAAAAAAPPIAQSVHEETDGSEEAAPPVAHEEKAAPEEGRPLARGAGTSVAKVIVDLLDFPSLDSSIIRVRGFDADLEEVFTATLSPSETAKVNGMLAAGEYLDREASGLLYFWQPDVVEYVGDVKDKIGLMTESAPKTEATTAQPGPDPSENEEVIDQATVASAAEVLIDALGGEETGKSKDEDVSAPPSPPSGPSEYMEEAAPTLAAAESMQELPPEPKLAKVRVPSPRAQAHPKVKKAIQKASNVTVAPEREANGDDYLLVSKSWYIQGGNGNREDAVRVSKVLKAFRWKVEPIYTIGVILDDMLSIETSRGQISGTLIRRVETAGYRLTAVAIDQGKPVAWFKREGSATPSLQVDSIAAGLDDSDIELEPDVTG